MIVPDRSNNSGPVGNVPNRSESSLAKTLGVLRHRAAPIFNLRYVSINAMRQIVGEEVAELHAAHGEAFKMQGPYTERLHAKHDAAMEKLRKHFSSVW